jgi:8-oxo-dGTP pyrophosphatase MutT (NUDIX family)/translation initiation factor 2B subunit (eIF-2B alpha/beta/delta family)
MILLFQALTKGPAVAAAMAAATEASTAAAAGVATAAASISSSIKRVVSCFILTGGNCRETVKIAIFHRVATMPTFPNHWAACSGSMEEAGSSGVAETPWQAACREVMEETNLLVGNTVLVERQYGLYIDVPYTNSRNRSSSIIRVYPFTVRLRGDETETKTEDFTFSSSSSSFYPPPPPALELRGTEHDRYQWVSVDELEALGSTAVPALARAFHHATFGRYLRVQQQQQQQQHDTSDSRMLPIDDETCDSYNERYDNDTTSLALSPAIQTWASDKVNGASTMVANAMNILLQIRRDQQSINNSKDGDMGNINSAIKIVNAAQLMKMLRPSMVPITNILTLIETQQLSLDHAVEALQLETAHTVNRAVQEIRPLIQQKQLGQHLSANSKAHNKAQDEEKYENKPAAVVHFRIATFSRSSTILAILKQLIHENNGHHHQVGMEIICGRSTPGNEGEIMASDVAALCNVTAGGNCVVCKVTCSDDDELEQRLSKKEDVDLFLVGSDCIMSDQVINKVGTMRMVEAAFKQQQRDGGESCDDEHCDDSSSRCLVYCCADRFKVWQDIFPPPLEEDIFECIPIMPYFDRMLIPPPLSTI